MPGTVHRPEDLPGPSRSLVDPLRVLHRRLIRQGGCRTLPQVGTRRGRNGSSPPVPLTWMMFDGQRQQRHGLLGVVRNRAALQRPGIASFLPFDSPTGDLTGGPSRPNRRLHSQDPSAAWSRCPPGDVGIAELDGSLRASACTWRIPAASAAMHDTPVVLVSGRRAEALGAGMSHLQRSLGRGPATCIRLPAGRTRFSDTRHRADRMSGGSY